LILVSSQDFKIGELCRSEARKILRRPKRSLKDFLEEEQADRQF